MGVVLEECRISVDDLKAQPAGLKNEKQTGEPLDSESDHRRRPNKSARSKARERATSPNVQGERIDKDVGRGRRRNDKKNEKAETKQASSSESEEPTSAAGSKQVNAPDPDIRCRNAPLRRDFPLPLDLAPRRHTRDRQECARCIRRSLMSRDRVGARRAQAARASALSRRPSASRARRRSRLPHVNTSPRQS